VAGRDKVFRGDRLFEARKARDNMSRDELSRESNVSSAQIYRYEMQGEEPTLAVAARLAKALEVTTDYLLGIVDHPTGEVHQEDLSEEERRWLAERRSELSSGTGA
jgi:transcriptional regulator with XRE-family HTH domain